MVEYLEPVKSENINRGCLTCSNVYRKAPMQTMICVGFGSAFVTKNGKLFFDGSMDFVNGKEPKRLSAIERVARKTKGVDWRLTLYGPLHGEVYQRQGRNNWVLVESNQGFA